MDDTDFIRNVQHNIISIVRKEKRAINKGLNCLLFYRTNKNLDYKIN